ncbi:MAG: redoxin domain-containing protein [Chloroflexota bacterium]|nr:redoxin domain-containing protein [Chloroflexota bacterium]
MKAARPRTRRHAGRGPDSAHSRRLWPFVLGGVILLAGVVYFGTSRGQQANTGSADDPRITLLAGQTAPDFSLPRVDGSGNWSPSSARGVSNVLLYFQEGSMCPPCWQQMRDLKRDRDKLEALNVQLVTITVDPIDLLKQTAAREQVADMLLLADTNLAVSKTYQMLYTGMMNGTTPGHSFMLIDTQGKIIWRRDFKEMYVPDPSILDPVARALGK